MKNRISKDLLQENLNIEEALTLQIKYSRYTTKINSNIKNIIPYNNIKTIAAVDVSYFMKNGREMGVACAVLWDNLQKADIEISYGLTQILFPYQAGFLGFREACAVALAIKNAKTKPDLLICDGHGLIHPRHFGEAVHIGLALNLPSFGVAKNPYVGNYYEKDLTKLKGNKTPIWEDKISNKVKGPKKIGYSICLADGKKPVYISIGYKTNLEIAVKVTLNASLTHRQPEPLYLADKLSRERVKELVYPRK